MRRAALLLLLLCLGCQDVNLRFVVKLPPGYTREELSLTATIFMPVADFASCDDLAYGDLSVDALRASQVAVVDLEDESAPVDPLPLGGYKLILVEGTGMARDPLGGSSKAVVVAGCVQLEEKPTRPGPFKAEREIEVQLEPAVWMQVMSADGEGGAPVSFSVEIPWQSELDLSPIRILLSDANLRVPVDGTLVRAQVIYGAGLQTEAGDIEPSVQIDEVLVESVSGFGLFTPRVHFAGPFEVVIAARWALGNSQQHVAGFAVPENASGDAFPGRQVLIARPARLGTAQSGFVATTAAGGRIYHSTALFSQFDASGAPVFTTTDVDMSALNAAEWASDCGTAVRQPDAESVTVLQPVRTNPLQELWWVDAHSNAQKAAMLPPPDASDPRVEWASTVPVGPCVIDGGPEVVADNGPVAVNLTALPEGNQGIGNRLMFANLILGTESNAGNGNASGPVNLAALTANPREVPVAMSSHCVTDEEGTIHRLLVFGMVEGELIQRFVMVDMGAGVVNAGQVDRGIFFDGRRVDDVSWLHYFDSTRGASGEPLLLGLSFQGFSYDVEALRVSSAGVILRQQQILATGLPPSVELLASGDLVARGSRDVVNVFPTFRGSSSTGYGQAVVTVISNSWDVDKPLLFSGYRIDENLNLDESDLMVEDGTGDQIDEVFLLLRMTDGTEPDGTDRWRTVASVIRLGAW